MNSINYQKELEAVIRGISGEQDVKSVLLHSCCAPCSSYCIEYLSQFFKVTVFYYNPNIYPDEEYYHRVKEQERFIKEFQENELKAGRKFYPVDFIEGDFEKDRFYDIARGLEKEPECGERCLKCYELRLGKTAELAKKLGFDYFTTTLTISPMKNSQVLNSVGKRVADIYGVTWLPSDFKKKEGYKRSCDISKEYNIYRQDYCGCVFSVRNGEKTADKK